MLSPNYALTASIDEAIENARAVSSAACDVARRWPPHALADCECIQVAETGKSEKRFGDGALEAGWIKVSTLIKKHEPENLKTEVTEPQQKAKEAITRGHKLYFCTL